MVVAAIWGCTNPLLKAGNEATATVAKSGNAVGDALKQIAATLLNWRFSIPFLVNQSGSLVYYYLLGSTEISMAVPIVNSLTFVFTALAAAALGERAQLNWSTVAGSAMIAAGVGICVLAKQS